MGTPTVPQIKDQHKHRAMAIAARMHMRPDADVVYYHDSGRHSIGVTLATDKTPSCSSSFCTGETACIHIQAAQLYLAAQAVALERLAETQLTITEAYRRLCDQCARADGHNAELYAKLCVIRQATRDLFIWQEDAHLTTPARLPAERPTQ